VRKLLLLQLLAVRRKTNGIHASSTLEASDSAQYSALVARLPKEWAASEHSQSPTHRGATSLVAVAGGANKVYVTVRAVRQCWVPATVAHGN
jgi:hypothetical protein